MNVKVAIRDRNTLILEEDAKKGDTIDLTSVTGFDSTTLEIALSNGKDEVYKKMLSEEKKGFEELANAKLDGVKKDYEKKITELVAKHDKELISLKSENKQLEKDNENSKTIKEIEQQKVIDSLKQELKDLKDKQELLISVKESEIREKYKEENDKLSKQIEIMKIEFDRDIEKARHDEHEKLGEELRAKDNKIYELERVKTLINVKRIGENLEIWSDNTVKEHMQNGLYNCTWEKDNVVIKDEGEKKGSKGDFIFKVYASEEKNKSEYLCGVLCEMKSENPDSVNKKGNADHYAQLDKNRRKKDCEYALLVSELDMDNPNDIPIYRVPDYKDMYVVRPSYLMVFLNMVASLNKHMSSVLLQAKKDDILFEDKQKLLDDFNQIKDTYLNKPLDSMRKQIESIKKSTDGITKATESIYKSIEAIESGYIIEIFNKIGKFELKLNSDIKKIAKLDNN